MNGNTGKTSLKDIWAYGLFWSWNIIFLAFMVLGFAPRLLPELIMAVGDGSIPLSYLIYAGALTCVPLAAVVLGLTLLRRAPARLFALGYVVEGPLMLLLAVRFFLIRQETAAMTLLLAVAGLGMAAFLWYALDPQRSGRVSGNLRLAGLTLMLLISLFASLWIAFYALPITAYAIKWIGRTLGDLPAFFRGTSDAIKGLIEGGWVWVPYGVTSFLLVLYTATLFVLAPIAVPILSLRAWRRSLSDLIQRTGRLLPAMVVISTVAIVGVLAVVTNRQPQIQAFALLDEPPDSVEEAEALLSRQESIRAGLINAYLAPFRYISALGEVRHVSDLYRDAFALTGVQAYQVQRVYEVVARPMLYAPAHPEPFGSEPSALQREPEEAARLYQRFFDTPIVEGEHEVVVDAVRSTWSADQAESAWQAIDDREVLLMQQEITINEHGDWADVELMEVYLNRTFQNQEVIYYFNLPELAVLTGLWLGNSPDREERFAYQVAPRGAAQAVYREQTRVIRDPALLEQIGPRQYRLRAFPVPPKSARWNDANSRRVVEEAKPLYLWLTYRAMADGDNWPLPHLAYKRNIFWNEDTQRLLNGASMQVEGDLWMPEAIASILPVKPVDHMVDFPDGTSVIIQPVTQGPQPELPDDLRLAVVLDRSRSMLARAEQVTNSLSDLETTLGSASNVDVYLTASRYRGEAPSRLRFSDVEPEQVLYIGGQNPAELLSQFESLRQNKQYDAILVLTDSGGYELGQTWINVPIPDAPVWMVHLGSDIPLGYDDQTLEAIQASGGGVSGDIDQALERLALSLSEPASTEAYRDVLDGYTWSVLTGGQVNTSTALRHSGEDGFVALAARRLILAEMRRNRGTIEDVDTLDKLHTLARQYGIVTPYSSMIVLVEAQQKELLEKLEQLEDRYDRDYEELKDTTPATQTPLTGVPEPHEWLLIGLAALMLVWYASQRRKFDLAKG